LNKWDELKGTRITVEVLGLDSCERMWSSRPNHKRDN